jgi:hypothetical protein
MRLTVVEVPERSVEKRTQRYRCRCDDGEVWFLVQNWVD